MKKIFFTAIVAATITSVSCTSEALQEKNSSLQNSSNSSELVQTNRPSDTIGGQGGTIPPPPPPFNP